MQNTEYLLLALLKMCFFLFCSHATISIYSTHRVNINLLYATANKQTINQFVPFVVYLFFSMEIYFCEHLHQQLFLCLYMICCFALVWLHGFLQFNRSIGETVQLSIGFAGNLLVYRRIRFRTVFPFLKRIQLRKCSWLWKWSLQLALWSL